MAQLAITNARTPGSSRTVHIVADSGRFTAVTAAEDPAPAADLTIDAAGRLVSPPLADAHFHLDSVLTGVPNRSGTLREGIDNWSEYKRTKLSVTDVYQRADRYCRRAFAQGIQAIRSHVDITEKRQIGVEALLRIRDDWREKIDIQLTAFPQDGLYADDETLKLMARALDAGLDVVGAIPHNERTAELGHRSLREAIRIAADRGLPADVHCDESDDPHSRHVEVLTEMTREFGMQGRVAASHITSTAMMDRYYLQRKLIPLMSAADMQVIVNPLINVYLGGRFHHPVPRGMAPIRDFLDAGLPVACGQDCNQDPWYPLGDANMFEAAKMAAHIAHMMGLEDLERIYSTVTLQPAKIMNLEGYGLEPGCQANAVIFDAPNEVEAMRTDARRVCILRRGEVLYSELGSQRHSPA